MNRFPTFILNRPILEAAGAEPLGPLWRVQNPPERLHVRGRKEALALLERIPQDGLAIVGTRAPQARSLRMVADRIGELRGSGLLIVSGFARGIDTEAHLRALEAELPTIAVLGTGLDHCYPSENAALALRILEAGGLLVTEFAPGTGARPWQFLLRNRLIGGWSRATWVIEAGARSGALNTARWARDHDRDTYATPCYPGDPSLAGNQTLLDRDHALPFWGTRSLGATWSRLNTHVAPSRSLPPPRDAAEHLLIAKITEETALRGGVTLQTLADWACAQGWESARLFTLLHGGITRRQLTESRGVFVALPENQLPLLL
jgi:DNA protecting protein DprA